MKIIEERYLVALRTYRSKIRLFSKLHVSEVPGFAPEDLEQEFSEVLYRVVESYDPNSGAKFNTYFWQCVRNRMSDLNKRAQAEKRQSEWFEFETELEPDAVSNVVLALELGDWRSMNRLNPEDWFMLRETVIERFTALRQTA